MTNASAGAARIASLDILRGVVILLMMLDHVRERFHMHTRTGDPIFEPIDPDLFFTRYVTHLCAPVFIFLAGLSAWSFLFLQVLWAIGLCMIGLSLACRLNYWSLGALGFLIVKHREKRDRPWLSYF